MPNWHRRNTGVYVRKRGEKYDIVFRSHNQWYVKVNANARLENGIGGYKSYRTRLEATSALDHWIAEQRAKDAVERAQESEKRERKPRGNVECPKCGGTGIYHGHGSVVNGVFNGFTGKCYACEGKGYQTDADQRRNWGYWQNATINIGA